ncbi:MULTISPECIES: phosphate signaling complex protein PhoU [Rodentibacter]|uniref:Phosphate-specific transport system accessory protein PhoU n=2 Tax=Rodentibacter TaxID=1960084 RepID=A0A1V3JBK3_9PAST|nr:MULTISPECIES: phosphate signaling complex protein PhoU [Rodentibacter]OOF54081.1 phosphate transport system regulatory protein PhoU [Rodentibacter genomosp. 2]OOF55949.1 phosphate transport system regulatory protein PhoU [Rodentibacter genomosp. 2]OOF78894.1 phosphate transport system regulatory protein PhoU [Rodentibacter heylii]OOF81118.1 phosphate transport system regulatory protein PhoU [Rodentibacter heylii]QIA77054.1 phosphate signaling complex protein PhoU [Rodentibacter heylii]
MKNQHISSHFNQELEGVRTEVMQMGGIVEQQIQIILQSLSQANPQGLQEVIESEKKINEMEELIDDHCQTIIARRQPAAGDLRFVLTTSRIIVDLERIGDELKKIAFYTNNLLINNKISASGLYDTHRILEMSFVMIRRALDAFARLDENAAVELRLSDEKLDMDYRNQLRLLTTNIFEQPQNISTWIDVMMMNKAVERIGDHAKNIAEHVVYLVRGIDIRHKGLAEIESNLK